ncbi:hypothetical protein DXT24_12690 [Enterococcus faecalis]|nr:hypothetical protein [Enterococcus faecalis]PQE44507.1 hypothetical protein CUS13_01195 [Enterococcus faecalis]
MKKISRKFWLKIKSRQEPGTKIDKRRKQKQHYALLRSQQLLRYFLDMRLVTVQPSKELQL